MRRIRKLEILELDETLETSSSSKLFCDKPYHIERKEEDGEIVWFGYSVNWIYTDNQWFVLCDTQWTPCDVPEYERMYQAIDIKKMRKLKLNNIERIK